MVAQSRRSLSRQELALWHAWQRASQRVNAAIARDVHEHAGLSATDFDVLSLLAALGRGKLRQQPLADALGWHKSRLSHHLSRMERRGLLRRSAHAANAVTLTLTAAGKHALQRARSVHAAAVRLHLSNRILPRDRQRALAVLSALAAGT